MYVICMHLLKDTVALASSIEISHSGSCNRLRSHYRVSFTALYCNGHDVSWGCMVFQVLLLHVVFHRLGS